MTFFFPCERIYSRIHYFPPSYEVSRSDSSFYFFVMKLCGIWNPVSQHDAGWGIYLRRKFNTQFHFAASRATWMDFMVQFCSGVRRVCVCVCTIDKNKILIFSLLENIYNFPRVTQRSVQFYVCYPMWSSYRIQMDSHYAKCNWRSPLLVFTSNTISALNRWNPGWSGHIYSR